MRSVFALIFVAGIAFAQSQPSTEQTRKPPQQTDQKTTNPEENKQIAKPNDGIASRWRFNEIIATQLQKSQLLHYKEQ
jgi:hypothetical protein